jgi:hypothetical protein
MAHELTATLEAALLDTRCKSVLTIVTVYWQEGIINYSEQEYLIIPETGIYTFPGLIQLGQLDIGKRLNNNGTTSSFDVVLSDSDGHLKEKVNREVLNGVKVEVWLGVKGIPKAESLLLATGLINGDSIRWKDASRVLSFQVETVVSSNDLTFRAYKDMITGANEGFEEKLWPFVFGSPKNVELVEYIGAKFAYSSKYFTYSGVTGNGEEAWIINSLSGFALDTTYIVDAYDADDPAGGTVRDNITGRFHPYIDGAFIFVQDSTNPSTTPLPVLQDRNMAGASGDPSPTDFRFWWVDTDPGVNDLTGKWVVFGDLQDRPIIHSCLILDHATDSGGNHYIELSHMPRWGSLEDERNSTGDLNWRNWYAKFIVSSNGKIQSNIFIQDIAELPKFQWGVRALRFYETTIIAGLGGSKQQRKTEDDDVTLREYIQQQVTSTGDSVIVAVTQLTGNEFITVYEFSFQPENKDSYSLGVKGYGWEFVDKNGFEQSTIQDVNEGGVKSIVFEPDDGLNSAKYIANIWPSILEQDGDANVKIFAETERSGSVIRIPPTQVTVTQDDLIPQEEIKHTLVEIEPPPIFNVADKLSGVVYSSLNTAMTVHDGIGGTIAVDTSNAVEVIAWLLNTYTSLSVSESDNFQELKAVVANRPMAFVINSEIDAITLAQQIAWEHKLVLLEFNNTVRIINLNVEPVIEQAFDKSNIELRSIEMGYTPLTDIITQFRFRYFAKKNDKVGQVIAFNNNVTRYGEKKQFIDILTHDNKEAVFDLMKFWGNRLSRSWRTVFFKASIDNVRLQPFDGITINHPQVSTNTVTGFIDDIRYTPDNKDLVLKVTLASEASDTNEDSQPVTDPSYWLGLTDLVLKNDLRVGILTPNDGAVNRRFILEDTNTLKPFQRRV